MLIKSTARSPFASLKFLSTAIVKRVTATPLGVCFNSGSTVILPIKITLFNILYNLRFYSSQITNNSLLSEFLNILILLPLHTPTASKVAGEVSF